MSQPEFDQYAHDYQGLLREPIRDRFAQDPRFYTERKWILLREFFRRRRQSTKLMSWLDVGCGEGDLLRYGQASFARVAGSDTSSGMLHAARGLEVRVQPAPNVLPYTENEFDLVTAVCVFHHVDPSERLALIHEMKRVLRPTGIICVIEHNAQNPVVRGMVRRIPVDANAILLRQAECHDLFRQAGFRSLGTEFFLYLPQKLFRLIAAAESLGRRLPFGGQFAAFAERTA
jgi:ubiquinone/menaquinone biosynthesis C-methylase UbiE